MTLSYIGCGPNSRSALVALAHREATKKARPLLRSSFGRLAASRRAA